MDKLAADDNINQSSAANWTKPYINTTIESVIFRIIFSSLHNVKNYVFQTILYNFLLP